MTPLFKPGETFRGYRIVRKLGEGGLGSVWLVQHEMLDTPLALKVLDRAIARGKNEYVKRFIREARLATKLRHRNLVAVHDAGYDDAKDVYYLVMDYVAGDTLRLAIAMGGPLPEAEAAGIILQMADVLDAAQNFGLVHRDLKPENIMVAPDGTVKLLDLGVAKVSNRMDSLRTMAQSVFGTPSYIAPEQAIDSSMVDPRADIYSLGVILFELVAGRRPYEGETPTEVLRQLLDDAPIPDVRDFAPGTTAALAALIAKMCAKKPENRFQTMRELGEAFRAAGFSPEVKPALAGPDGNAGPSMGELLRNAASAAGETTLSDISLCTTDPDIAAFIARRKRIKTLKTAVKIAAGAAATLGTIALLALKIAAAVAILVFAAFAANAECVNVADCERDPAKDVWAAADVAYAREVMSDVFASAGIEPRRLDFGKDSLFDPARAEVVLSAYKTPALERDYDFPLQPLGRMHFALYATPERAKKILPCKITDWPRMRVGYSPVAQGGNDDRERYFERATLSPEYVEFATSAAAVAALKAGEIDLLFLYTAFGKRPEGLVEVVPIGARNVYFAVRKDRPELLSKLQAAYRECYIGNVERYDALREQLLGIARPRNRVRVAAYLRGHLFELSPSGECSGVIEDWLTAVAGHAHWTLDYVYGSYEQCVEDVASGRLDCVGGLGFTASRGDRLLYPHTPMGMLRVYLWTKQNSRFKPGDQSTWKGMRVGLLSGSFSADRVKQQLESNGNPTGIVCREYATDDELMKAYFDGEIDACVDIEMPAVDKEKALHVYASHPMYICVSPKRRDLFLELEKALGLVCDDFPKYMKMISERHYGIRDEMSLLTFKEAEWLKARAKNPEPVRIDFSPWPVNLKNDKGEIVHFAKEFLSSLSRRTGLSFDVQPQTGIQTAEAKFQRGDTQFWIPYPAKVDVASMGGVSVAAIPVPKTYRHMISPETIDDDLEIWANRDVPDELAGIVRKAVAGIEPAELQEMFIKAATERTIAKRIFGMTDAEFERLLSAIAFVVLSAVAVFGVVMVLLLRHQVRRANKAAKLAEEYSRAKTRFLAMMSHELRTPLNAVIGFAEFLARADCDAAQQREYITGIQLSANTLLDLINDVLDLSKLDSGAMHMLSGECDVAKTIEELPAIFNYKVRRTGVPLVVRHMSRAPVPVLKLSPQGLKQILINLVGNAAKFTTKGSITVDYDWDAASNTLSFSVADTGCGISSVKMERLFDPFVQDIASRMQHAGNEQRGTGLGLPIVKKMVDNAGGTIDVTSEPGKGTRFAISIPGLEVLRPGTPVQTTSSSRLPERILVVDDIPINRKVLGIHLKNLGAADVRFAENGRAALEQMKDWTPAAVLSDMWMPEMDGQQLVAEMRKIPALAHIPVVAITADVDVASTYDMSNFAQVIAKPVTSEKLQTLFSEL